MDAGGSLKVLIVEDEPALLALVSDFLSDEGCRCCCAADADTALELIAEQEFDLLFTDIMMPGSMNGLQLAAACAATHPSMAIVVTSGFFKEQGGRKAQIPFPFLPKPYSITAVLALFATAISTRVLAPQAAPPLSPDMAGILALSGAGRTARISA